MRDAVAALEAALSELEQARAELPYDLRHEIDGIIQQARSVLRSIEGSPPTAGSDRADATG